MATTVKKFSASWCGPCRMLAPMMESIKPAYNGVKFVDIDIDENSELAAQYGVRSVPTVIVEKDGVEVNRFVGVQSAMTYRNAINETL